MTRHDLAALAAPLALILRLTRSWARLRLGKENANEKVLECHFYWWLNAVNRFVTWGVI